MLIFLDSSIFCADFHLTSTSFELLKDYICKGGNWLCFSEIVIDEVKNKYKERITGLWQKANSDIQELNKSMVTNVPTIPEEHISSEMKSYEDFWDMIPFQYGNGAPEDYPTTTHRDVVHRALERKKPFKDDGKDGYRDYLIWLTFLNVVHHYGLYPVKQTMKKMASYCRIETTTGGHSHGKKVYESRASDQHH